MRVPDQHRPGAEQVIDVFLAVLVPDPAALALADDDLAREIAEGAARQDALRRLEDVVSRPCPRSCSPKRPCACRLATRAHRGRHPGEGWTSTAFKRDYRRVKTASRYRDLDNRLAAILAEAGQ